MWQDAFEVYQSAQSGEPFRLERADPKIDSTKKTGSKSQTVYVFAYFSDAEGKTHRDMPVQERLTLLELRQAELDARCQELEDYLDISNNE